MNLSHTQLSGLYGPDETRVRYQSQRYQRLIRMFHSRFAERDIHIISVPGRTELGGNHTDHNNGKVLAAAIHLDTIAAAAVNSTGKITLFSEGYTEPFEVDLNELGPKEEEQGSTTALIRGVAARFKALGYSIGGFNAQITSDVLPGSGLSSSASFEVLLGALFNRLFNNGLISAEILARVGQYAENVFFGKPCGLMDQMACALGGVVEIDFKNQENPQTKQIKVDLSAHEISLLMVHTGGDHADLTGAYAAIPADMKAVAFFFGKRYLREIRETEFIQKIPELRQQAGDRALLRAFHFFQENKRVDAMANALEKGEMADFLELVTASGDSSFKWLQNINLPDESHKQNMALALGLSEGFIDQAGLGACRVHGGGFAGTIQVFIPQRALADYKQLIEPVFGKKSVQELLIRPMGIFNYA